MSLWHSVIVYSHSSKTCLTSAFLYIYFGWLDGNGLKFHNKLPLLLVSPSGFQKHSTSCRKRIILCNSHLAGAPIVTAMINLAILGLDWRIATKNGRGWGGWTVQPHNAKIYLTAVSYFCIGTRLKIKNALIVSKN